MPILLPTLLNFQGSAHLSGVGSFSKKLWKLLIDRDMMKKDLAEKAGISNASIAKLGRNENVNTDILLKICVALGCDVADILEIVSDESE